MLQRYRGFVRDQAAGGDGNAAKLLGTIAQAEQLSTLMDESSERINQLVAGLKQFVALDEAESRSFDVREGIDTAVTLLSPSCGDGVRISKRYPERPPRVDCYPARLNQVFVNLLQNAIDALAGDGEIEIRVGWRDGNVEVEFSDNGPGIPAGRLGELFEFGFTQKAGRIGLRLGLPSSRRLLQDMGGQISIDSEPGQGTQVRLLIPRSSGSAPG
jgi:two-component system NtrC family sensor kinase